MVNPKEVQNVLLKCFVHEVRIIVLFRMTMGILKLLDVISTEMDLFVPLKRNTELVVDWNLLYQT